MTMASAGLVRVARAAWEFGLQVTHGRRGVIRQVNGVPFRVLPGHRWQFSPEYDRAVASYFRDRVKPDAVCVSVGSNLGIYPLQFSHWNRPTGRVYAFEPNPQTAYALRTHVAINGLTDRIEVVQKAVSAAAGEADFHAHELDGMSRLGEPNPALLGKTRPIRVPVVSLDDFFRPLDAQPSALMVDVEGFEIEVLRGAKRVVAGAAVVVEMHPDAWAVAGTDRDQFERLLSELRLRAVPLSGQRDPFADYGHVALEPVSS